MKLECHTMYLNIRNLNSIQLNLNSIEFELNLISIQVMSHAMSFNIFIQMKLSFPKINSLFQHFIVTGSLQQCRDQVAYTTVLPTQSLLLDSR